MNRQRPAINQAYGVMIRIAFLLCALSLAPTAASAQGSAVPELGQASKDSVWVPTPPRMIRRLLQMADTTKDDVVIDLGAGDGRIPIYAAKHFGARGVAVELEANLVRVAREAAHAQGVGHLVRVIQQDLFDADVSAGTVIALYISPGAMQRLRPRLLELRPGTRIVSHQFDLGDWEPDEKIEVEGRKGYLWVVPAAVEGAWRVSVPGQDLRLQLGRRHQALTAAGERDGKNVQVLGARLRGDEIAFSAFDRDGEARNYTGRLVEGRLVGEAAAWNGAKPLRWSAVRESR
jgi:protein-L-isoaspartate O-methyltransferase